MYCNYCRSLNPNDATYCSACGRAISLASDTPERQTQVSKAAETPPIVAPPSATAHQDDGQTAPNIKFGEGHDIQGTAAPPISVLTSANEQKKSSEHAPTIAVESVQASQSGVPSSPTNLDCPSLVPVYGTMGQRFTGYFADLIVIYFVFFMFYVVVGALNLPLTANEAEAYPVWFGTLFLYMVVAQAAYHTTIGKYVHGLEVCSANPNRKYPAFWRIVLRETLGRLFSSLFWGLGYWFASKKPKIQAWSDELAGTVVSVRPTNRVLVRALTAFIFIAFFLDVGLTGYGLYKQDWNKKYTAFSQEMGAASDAVIAARKDVDNRLNSAPKVNTWTDFGVWQDVMKSLKNDLNVYESRIDNIQALIQRGISEGLTASQAERGQFVILRQVYDLRKQQAEKLRQEANMIASCAPTLSSYAGLQTDLQLLDSDIKGLESQVSPLMAEINKK